MGFKHGQYLTYNDDGEDRNPADIRYRNDPALA